jgi:hypothetical protein
MTFEDYILLLPAPPSPLVEASMREGWNACMKQRDARIAELEQDLQTTADALGHVVAQTEEGYPGIAHDFVQANLTLAQQAARIKELEERRCEICGYAEHHREHTGCLRVFVDEQAAEISRLKAVIGKCKETLGSNVSDLQEPNFVTLASCRVREALAAIKEIES